MSTQNTNGLLAFKQLFEPIARVLLRNGVSWKELANTAKAAYVKSATQHFGIDGRPTNISRVALMTGLTRKEVSRLRKLPEDDHTALTHMNRASRVLSGWHQDEAFSDEQGNPLPLSPEGDSSFATLCSQYAPDVPATALLKELINAGTIKETSDSLLIAKARYYMPEQMDPVQLLRFGSVMEDMGNTIAHNLHRDDSQLARFERRASNTAIPIEAVPDFRDFVEKEAQAFLEHIDDWLSAHEQPEADHTTLVRLGLGAYWIEDNTTERTTS